MLPLTSEFYPPIELDYLINKLSVDKSLALELISTNAIKTKKIGRKIYVSKASLLTYMTNYPKNKKKLQKRIVQRKIGLLREDKIMEYSKVIKEMRDSNRKQMKKLKDMKELDTKTNITHNINMTDDFFSIVDISIEPTYAQIKKIIKEVREMELIVL